MKQVQRKLAHLTLLSFHAIISLFTCYLNDDYDEDNPDKYDINLAYMCINFYTSDYQDRAHAHVLNVLLDAAVNNETTLALEENGVTSLPALLEYICTPGLIFGLRWKDKNDDNMEKMLHAGQYEELLALFSYFNWLQSAYGLWPHC